MVGDPTTTATTIVEDDDDDQQQQWSIVLFYKYFVNNKKAENDDGTTASPCCAEEYVTHYPEYYVEKIHSFCKHLCEKLDLKGRLLIASEGINGTVSASSRNIVEQFIDSMNRFDLIRDCGLPNNNNNSNNNQQQQQSYLLFDGIDWKISTCHQSKIVEPFPDIKVSVVKEIISTGGIVSLADVERDGGIHLSPQEFHATIQREQQNVVLVDVRNTFEHAIGHFIHPTTHQPAINPETITFSSFDATFCNKYASQFQDKMVLMYCTGGIRCEKASVMLKQRGVQHVYQLSGGIHRYLETYGEDGYFKGKNFVFDQRVAQTPAECKNSEMNTDLLSNNNIHMNNDDNGTVVGTCIECCTKYDELDGSRVCTVCRDLVLVCPKCQTTLREYHCSRHAAWKTCYWTFLEVFDETELWQQKQQLMALRDTYIPASEHKNVRRTLSRQIEKVSQHIQALQNSETMVNRDAPRRCRTCFESIDVCDGRCWGFWRTTQRPTSIEESNASTLIVNNAIPDIQVGDSVRPGPHWNELRLGKPKNVKGNELLGTVVDIKTWGAGSLGRDCVAVIWHNDPDRKDQPLIYRWGVISRNGKPMYDVEHALAPESISR